MVPVSREEAEQKHHQRKHD